MRREENISVNIESIGGWRKLALEEWLIRCQGARFPELEFLVFQGCRGDKEV